MDKHNKSIAFLMPGIGGIGPVGGYKVVYEYANMLVKDGYNVTIMYPITLNFKKYDYISKLRVIPHYLKWRIKGISGGSWFNLDNRVKEKLVLSLNYCHVPNNDFYFATSIETAYYLKDYPVNLESKAYLIQGYENWGMTKAEVDASYKFGFKNFTISKWLHDKVAKTGGDSFLLKNGFDFNYFKLSTPIDSRNRYAISMLYHDNEKKGCKYGIEALTKVKEIYPELKATLFGVPERPLNLPIWIQYFQTPDRDLHNKIYNESSIYLAPSLQEGWGLTVGEAMICGAAIICTDTLGFREMVENGRNGIIVPTKDIDSLVDAIIKLISNDKLRISFAKQGNEDIKAFTWDKSYNLLKDIINQQPFKI